VSWVKKNPPQEVRDCCESLTTENHRDNCPIILRLNESYREDYDGSRWRDSYIHHNTENVAKRAERDRIQATLDQIVEDWDKEA
jgi:hypothetical protein